MLNRPRNRNRNNDASTSHRGSERGRGSRGGNHHGGNRAHQQMAQVPSARQVVPGAGVSIILKVDQPTGRQVQGIISEVLGRGDHPRGIKVRIVDGRVGRVQAMVAEDAARAASEGMANLGRNGEVGGSEPRHVTTSRRMYRRDEDLRTDGYDYESVEDGREGSNLMDYVKTKPMKKSKTPAAQATTSMRTKIDDDDTEAASTGELVRCPVCSEFEGDERAVAFHVNTHFE